VLLAATGGTDGVLLADIDGTYGVFYLTPVDLSVCC
jgi:hypothetical protein